MGSGVLWFHAHLMLCQMHRAAAPCYSVPWLPVCNLPSQGLGSPILVYLPQCHVASGSFAKAFCLSFSYCERRVAAAPPSSRGWPDRTLGRYSQLLSSEGPDWEVWGLGSGGRH